MRDITSSVVACRPRLRLHHVHSSLISNQYRPDGNQTICLADDQFSVLSSVYATPTNTASDMQPMHVWFSNYDDVRSFGRFRQFYSGHSTLWGVGGGGSRLLAHLVVCFQHGSKADPFELRTDRRTDGQQHRLMPAL